MGGGAVTIMTKSLVAKTATLMNSVATPRLFDQLADLRERWKDERDYEDFADYSKAVAALLKGHDGVRFVKLSKAFVIEVALDIRPNEKFEIFVTARQGGWRKVVRK
jgi:hypothetical protein